MVRRPDFFFFASLIKYLSLEVVLRHIQFRTTFDSALGTETNLNQILKILKITQQQK